MCADTVTNHYRWVKPEIAASAATWGAKLNADLDGIDAQLYTTALQAAQGDTSVGDIKMYAGATPPTNWKLCDGTVYQNSDIPLLAPVLNNQYGGVPGVSNAVPDLRQKFPIGAGTVGSVALALGATGGEATHTLTTAEMPSHTHTPTVTDPGHTHTYSRKQFIASLAIAAGTTYSTVDETTDTTDPATTGITVANATVGGDGAHNNLPPYVGVNFIVKYR